MIGEIGTLAGVIASFISLVIAFYLYIKTKKSKSIWVEFGEFLFTVSFILLMLALTGLLYLMLRSRDILWLDIVLILLLPITIFYFYTTVITVFEDFLGVRE